MATESVASLPTHLWSSIGQLEAVIESANVELCSYCENMDADARMAIVNQAHHLILAAKTVGDALAREVGMR